MPANTRLKAKGRRGGESEPFAMIPVKVLRSAAYATAPLAAAKVLTILAAQFGGRNNGSLSLTRKTAAEFGITDPHLLVRSLWELRARGLIALTRPGMRAPRSRSALYAVTWRHIDPPQRGDEHDASPTISASDEWSEWETPPNMSREGWTVGRVRPRDSEEKSRRNVGLTTQTGGSHSTNKQIIGGSDHTKKQETLVDQTHTSQISGVDVEEKKGTAA